MRLIVLKSLRQGIFPKDKRLYINFKKSDRILRKQTYQNKNLTFIRLNNN